MSELWLQVTAGTGPAECEWAMARVAEAIIAEAGAAGIAVRTTESSTGSMLLALSGELDRFINAWRGTVQWVGRSPFRPDHKRKNWFVGVSVLQPVEATRFDAKDVKWETMCASGPGGQHVNKTESAVRVTHLPTGIQATAAEERSQFRNRKLALARLALKLSEMEERQRGAVRERRWQAHQALERGNPVRILRA
jgi:peptide chain release factor